MEIETVEQVLDNPVKITQKVHIVLKDEYGNIKEERTSEEPVELSEELLEEINK